MVPECQIKECMMGSWETGEYRDGEIVFKWILKKLHSTWLWTWQWTFLCVI